MRSRTNTPITPMTREDALSTLDKVSSFPIREDQAGMTPEQRKVVNEIMTKVFEIMRKEGKQVGQQEGSSPKVPTMVKATTSSRVPTEEGE